jgi:signal peptidase I
MSRRLRLMIGLLILLFLMGILLALASNKLQIEQVISDSMAPTLLVGDEILSDANAMPDRYQIICFNSPEDADEKLVKRIIGVPGDEIRIRDGIIYVNGKEEYSPQVDNRIQWKDIKVTIPRSGVFVLGDNRNNSHDSLNFGPVPYKNIRGVATMIIWPPSHWGRPKALH